MGSLPIWEILLKKKLEETSNFLFKYTLDGNLKRYGDISTTVIFEGVLASYIIDFGAENYGWGTKFSPEHLLKKNRALSEVLLFNMGELCDDEVYQILAFNGYDKIPFSILNETGLRHCSSHAAQFEYKVNFINGHCNIRNEEYYLDGDEYTEDEWNAKKRSMKIDKIKQSFTSNL